MGGIHEECGVFGIYCNNPANAAMNAYIALYALQHRGQASCGIAVNDKGVFSSRNDAGLVHEVFDKEELDKLGDGNISIGHVRYADDNNSSRSDAQPLVVRHVKGPMAIAHNGRLVNARELRESYEMRGAIFHGTSNAEVISYAITQQRIVRQSIEESLEQAMYEMKGAYSLVLMSPKKLIAARDPHGFRPLSLGKLNGDAYVVASETCAFDGIGAEFIRDILPGEIVVIDDEGIRSIKTHCGQKSSMCIFEYIYFARPDSFVEGCSVHRARIRAGEFLWEEHPVNADVVIGVPDSGIDAAIGFSRASGIPYGIGFIKNRYVGRTFIEPGQSERTNLVKIKLNTVKDTIAGKRVVLVDDSIVRGTTSRRIVGLIRDAGAKEIHVRISCPPFINLCYFGTDVTNRDSLIACKMPLAEICEQIGADTLGYLSVENVRKLADTAECGFCDGCFTGDYPMEVPGQIPKDKFEFKIGEVL